MYEGSPMLNCLYKRESYLIILSLPKSVGWMPPYAALPTKEIRAINFVERAIMLVIQEK